MGSRNWSMIFILCALAGVLAGYFVTLFLKPTLIPPMLRIGFLREPTTVLLMGTDVVYNGKGRRKTADASSFQGRSDTIMVARMDPFSNSFVLLSIPRDTLAYIPDHGRQKINAANAIGGPELTRVTVSNLLQMNIEHYLVLNVRGLVECVDEVGGITIDVPKRLKYKDNSAKLNIDLQPGPAKLTGTEAMGFVRFRHDSLGDIGRVQRQELFIRAALDKAMEAETWAHLPDLITIANKYILTDLNPADMAAMAAFVRAVPKDRQSLVLLPGNFSGTGDWEVDKSEVRRMVAKLTGSTFVESDRRHLRVTIRNASSDRRMARKLLNVLRSKGYRSISIKTAKEDQGAPHATTQIIAQRGNPEDAELLKMDLAGSGEIVNASVGDIESAVTIIIGDDLLSLVSAPNKG